jgi:glucose-1-phosphate adenylyltransferase
MSSIKIASSLPIKEPKLQEIVGTPADMNRVAAIILGGGQGTRLFPLTVTRCKPAISFGGRYRLIDIPMSNSINSGCLKIYIVTQFLSASLHQHIFKTYRLGTFSSGFIELLPAEQKHHNHVWYQGTADAVRQNLDYFQEAPVDYFLILSGDQLYNMDFQKMVAFAKKTDADLVIASLPIEEHDAKRMGILKTDEQQNITHFIEKPQEKSLLEEFRMDQKTTRQYGLDDSKDHYLASMGIYIFKREVLFKLLFEDHREDFGKHLIPTKVNEGKTVAYIHQGYWEDIGTIESFYHANMALTTPTPPFNWYDEERPIFTSPHNLPGPKIYNSHINHSIICEGCIVDADEVSKSILGPRSVIKKGSIIRGSYVMGNDYYEPPIRSETLPRELQIGENCIIRNAIIDKHVHIGNGVQLINRNKLKTYDSSDVYIRDGIIIVTRGATLPDGFVL